MRMRIWRRGGNRRWKNK